MKQLVTSICLLLSTYCLAQNPAFVVVDVTGSVTTSQNKKALIGTKIADNETITVAPGAKISLACKNSGCAQFIKPGKYVLKSDQYCKEVTDPIFAKLCKYAWQQIAGNGGEDKWSEHIDNIGAASRGAPCVASISHNLSDISYYEGDFALSWHTTGKSVQLLLKVFRYRNSEPLLEIPLNKNSYPLAQLKKKLKEGTDYYWNVSSKETNCDDLSHILIMTHQYRDSVVNSLTATVSSNIADPAAQQYWTGVLLENDHFFVEAYQCYGKAAKLAPGEIRYREEVQAFRKRYTTN